MRMELVAVMLLASLAARSGEDSIILPEPEEDSGVTVVEAIERRRSVRSYSGDPVSLPQLARLLHCAQGLTSPWGFRAAPSAGATYPMTLYVVAEEVDELEPGIYVFNPDGMSLEPLKEGDFLQELSEAALGQPCISGAALAVVMVADFSVTTDVYGERGFMYVHMEAGHISQNIYLQATAMDLGTVAVGAFMDDDVAGLLELGAGMIPLYIMPVGGI
ncbi:MAG: SagB/ThcOx family dehydrogenase [Candidatus Fermentibacteraceae bacterium]|nr:SagB/ThcOx family dehydrogenase [Candidatus Fermentibacteraceae bacterium]MBN2607577.1 SagB/ThcOx family dehydrogenase [Candidatus Fermentibacteraceae bacterium]